MNEVIPEENTTEVGEKKLEAEGGEREVKSEVVVQKKRKRGPRKRVPQKISNLDLNSGQHRYVTVDSFTVLITEYKEKQNQSEDSD